jgi:hypothetical protein
MASTYTPLGIEKMATGENAGTWGTKTNANLDLIEQVLGGYKAVSIAGGAQTTALTVADGALTGTAQARMIEFTGSITGNQIVTIPLDVENFYILKIQHQVLTQFNLNMHQEVVIHLLLQQLIKEQQFYLQQQMMELIQILFKFKQVEML